MNFLNNQHLKFVNCPIFLQDVKTSMAVQNLVFDAYTNSVASWNGQGIIRENTEVSHPPAKILFFPSSTQTQAPRMGTKLCAESFDCIESLKV